MTINPPLASFSLVGSQTLSVVLKDALWAQKAYSFTITVVNTEPTFSSALPSTAVDANVGASTSYSLPSMSDFEGHTITVSYTLLTAGNTFTTFDSASNKFIFAPLTNAAVGTFTIQVTLKDGGTFKTS